MRQADDVGGGDVRVLLEHLERGELGALAGGQHRGREHGDRRVLEARIGHALRLAREAIGHGLRILVGIAGRQEQRLAGLAML